MSNVMLVMTAALAAELFLVLLGLLLFSWIKNRAARNRDIKAMRVLVARIKKSMDERDAEIEGFLADGMGLSGEPLQQTKVSIRRAELELLKRFASVYKKRDAGAAAQFDIDLVTGLAPYLALRGTAQGTVVEEAPADPSEIEALRAQNARLSEELSVTMETMARMLNEYSSMFSGGAPGAAIPMEDLVGTDGETTDAVEDPDSGADATSSQPLEDDIEIDVAIAETPQAVELDTSEVTEGPAAGAVTTDPQDDLQAVAAAADDADVPSPDSAAAADSQQDDIDALFAAEAQQDLVNASDPEEPTTAEAGPVVAAVEEPESYDTAELAGPVPDAASEQLLPDPGAGAETEEADPAAVAAPSADLEDDLTEFEEADLPDDYLEEAVTADLSPQQPLGEPERSSADSALDASLQAEVAEHPADDKAAVAGTAAVVSEDRVDEIGDTGLPEGPTDIEQPGVAGHDRGGESVAEEAEASSQPVMDEPGNPSADVAAGVSAEVMAGPADDSAEADAGPAAVVAAEEADAADEPGMDGLFDTADASMGAFDAQDEAVVENPEVLSQQDTDDPESSLANRDLGVSAEATGETAEVPAPADVEAAWEMVEDGVDATDDLEHTTSLFDTGETEVVAFDDQDDFDVELAGDADGLFDPVEPETLERAEHEVEEVLEDIDALFDAVEEPLKTQSGS